MRWDDWNVLQQYGHAILAYSGGIDALDERGGVAALHLQRQRKRVPHCERLLPLQLEHPAGRPGRTLQLLLLDRCALEAVPQGDRSPTATVQVLQGPACRRHTGLVGLDRLLGRIARRLAVEHIASNEWLRFYDTQADTDPSGHQFHATDVVIQVVKTQPGPYNESGPDSPDVESLMIGTGTGIRAS